MIYKVVRCPNCGFFQVTSSKTSLKCQKCNKSRVLSKVKIFYQDADARMCARVLIKVKEQVAVNMDKYSEEFESVI